MLGETSLTKLLSQVEPVLVDGIYVFAVANVDAPFVRDAKMVFHEAEGTTIIIEKNKLP